MTKTDEVETIRHAEILNRRQSALLIVDIQQKINAVMLHRARVIASTVTLIKACRVLEVPIFLTEQYPKGLGTTEEQIMSALAGTEALQKMSFSCGSDTLLAQLREKGIRQVIVAGIECHVCVLQTALDLIANGLQVHIAVDAVSSRKELDYKTALGRMARAGAVTTTVESVLFEILERAGTPEFKEVSKLIK